MPLNKHDHLLRAGDLEQTTNTEIFYLAPRQIPTGATPFSARQLHQVANEVYLDFALGIPSLEFAVRCYIGWLMGLIIFCGIIGVGTGIADYLIHGIPFLETAIPFVFSNWVLWIIVGFFGSCFAYLFLKTVYQLLLHPPIRFNRQRREVAYVAKRGEPPRIIPWEEVIACVSSGTVATDYGVQNRFALMIGLRDASDGQVVWLTVPSATLGLAVSEWEAIRVYMEEGPAALPLPFMAGMPDEGTVAFFHACRRDYRERHWYVRYLFGFLLIQFCSGWTLPCCISEWVERLPKASFPKTVRDWSKPLPRDQWQAPSAELLEESEAVRRSFREGKTLFDHLRKPTKVKNELHA